MNRKVSVIEDLDGKKIVFIHDIKFKGKRAVNWNEVKEYLKNYVGEFYDIRSELGKGTEVIIRIPAKK